MAGAQSAWNNLDQMLTCAVCLSQLNDPRLLPCQHSFCAKCVNNVLQRQTPSYHTTPEFPCPVCRNPASGVTRAEDLPVDFRAKEFIALREKLKADALNGKSKESNCSVCGTSDMARTSVCIDCGKAYCSDCHTQHSRRFPGHVHCSVESTELSPLRCSDHGDFVRSFCMECDRGICERCFLTPAHGNHTTKDFAVCEVTKYTEDIEKKAAEKEQLLSKALDDIQLAQDREDSLMKETSTAIISRKENLIENLNKIEATLFVELDIFAKENNMKRILNKNSVEASIEILAVHKRDYEHSKQPLKGVAGIALKTEHGNQAKKLSEYLDNMENPTVKPVSKILFYPGSTDFPEYGKLENVEEQPTTDSKGSLRQVMKEYQATATRARHDS